MGLYHSLPIPLTSGFRGILGVPLIGGIGAIYDVCYDVWHTKTMLSPIYNDTRCVTMIVSFEPTKIGFFTENANNCCFSNQ